jgi:rubredoxin
MEEEKFQLLRRFQYSSEALIYQGKLESQGIEAFLRDNNTIDNFALYSIAVGGVKLYVKTEDFSRANEILNDVSLYSVDDKNQLIKCPECGTEQIEMVTSIKNVTSFLAYLFSWILMVMPFYIKHKYQCQNCKYQFD